MHLRFLPHNGTHQRPHAEGSARGRDGLVIARTLVARGQALYVSRLDAWVCWAARLAMRWTSKAYGLLLCQYRGFLA
jgi:hypothetical protein